jgi:hypothetical protein
MHQAAVLVSFALDALALQQDGLVNRPGFVGCCFA